MKKILTLMCCLFAAASMALAEVTPVQPSGSGTASSPYLINTAAKLLWYAKNMTWEGAVAFNSHAKLTADIDLSTVCGEGIGSWTPIGEGDEYYGTFDGNNHTISGLYIHNDDSGSFGLFYGFKDATIKNLTLTNVDILCSNGSEVGALAGYTSIFYKDLTIDNVSVSGKVEGYTDVGGFVGSTFSGSLTNSTNNAEVKASSMNAGGFTGRGYTNKATYSNLVNKGNVTASRCAGGITAGFRGTMTDCVNEGNITATHTTLDSYIGGLAGNIMNNYSGNDGINPGINRCINRGKITGRSSIGGIANSSSDAIVKNCLNEGDIEGNGSSLGGILGEVSNEGNTTIERCLNTGNIATNSSSVKIGYIFGQVDAMYGGYCTISNSYASTAAKLTYLGSWGNKLTELDQFAYPKGENLTLNNNGKFSEEQISNGYAAYMLQGNQTTTEWGQKMSSETSPSPKTTDRVYLNGTYACDGTIDGSFTNTVSTGIIQDHAYNSDGVCANCHGYEQPQLEEGYYLIANVGNLIWYANACNKGEGGNAKLTADIDLSAVCGEGIGSWTPIGTYALKYPHEFNGQGHTISHLYVNIEDNYCGLFGAVDGGSIQDLSLTDAYVKGNCRTGFVAGDLCGYIANVKVLSGTLTGSSYTGGITGYAEYSEIEYCENHGAIYSKNSGSGGIVGCMYDQVDVVGCTNTGNIASVTGASTSKSGGIAGSMNSYNSLVQACLNTGSVTVTDNYAAGIVGYCYYSCAVIQCLNTGNIKSTKQTTQEELGYITNFLDESTCTLFDNFVGPSVKITYKGGSYTGEDKYASMTQLTNGNGPFTVARATSTQMRNGYVAYYLGYNDDGDDPDWGQKIGTDATPVLGGDRVYLSGVVGCDGLMKSGKFTNTETEPTVEDHVYNTYHICTNCNTGEEPDYIDDTYQINNLGNLMWVRDHVNKGLTNPKISLNTNLDISPLCQAEGGWKPIGDTSDHTFRGQFQGNHNRISGLRINATDSNKGFFGCLGGEVSDLTVSGEIVASNDNVYYMGLIAGYAFGGKIINCIAEGKITGGSCCGGIVGNIFGVTVKDCVNKATVNTNVSAGGIAGQSNVSHIETCANYADITASGEKAGGIVGSSISDDVIKYCGNYGNIKALECTGGIAGAFDGDTLSYCFTSGKATSTSIDNASTTHSVIGNSSTCTAESVHDNYFSTLSYAGGTKTENDPYAEYVTSLYVKNGRIANKLGAPWGQKLDTDLMPYLYHAPVYYGRYQHAVDVKLYTTSKYSNLILTYNYEGHKMVDDVCTICGKHAELVTKGGSKTYADWVSENHEDSSTSAKHIYKFTNVKAGDSLSFDYTVSSEPSYDQFYAILYDTNDDDVARFANGESGIVSESVNYTFTQDGSYYLEVWYHKDYMDSKNDDQATVSNLKYISSQPVTYEKYGDLNKDGKFDELDCETLSDMLAGKKEATTDADFNGDGKVSVDDMAEMIKQLLLP